MSARASCDTAVGTELPSLRKEMVIQTMRSRALGGRNPIHWDAEYARSQGFRAPIATGQMSSAFIAEMCLNFFGTLLYDGSTIECKYVRPVFAGDVITARGVISERTEVGGRVRLKVDVWCENQSGEKVTIGTVEAWAEPPPPGGKES